MIRAFIVDDEPLARRGVRVCLRRAEDIQVVGEADAGDSALESIRRLRPELLFLDVQMPGMDGFELLSRLAPTELPLVIFLTAYDAYALEAFRVHALDYLMKPIDDDRFDAAVQLARLRLQEQRAGEQVDQLLRLLHAGTASGASWLTRFELRQGGRTHWIPTDQVDWIEASGDYVVLHAGARLHMLNASMDGIERRLDPARFVRIHRSTIVALDRIRKFGLLPTRDALLTLADGTELRVSRRFRHRLRLEDISMPGTPENKDATILTPGMPGHAR